MKQPESFVIHGQENKVCKLDNYLYGLKYTHEEWHEKLTFECYRMSIK